jgi:putative nucleotidyltransferase with HDIG domain
VFVLSKLASQFEREVLAAAKDSYCSVVEAVKRGCSGQLSPTLAAQVSPFFEALRHMFHGEPDTLFAFCEQLDPSPAASGNQLDEQGHRAKDSACYNTPVSLEELVGRLRAPPELLCRVSDVPGLMLVGGVLRDWFWGEDTCDVDLAASAPMNEVLSLLEERLQAKPFGLGQRFSTYRLNVGKYCIDVSPLHEEGLAADLARRDYTVNALAVSAGVLGGEAGQEDIAFHGQALADLESRTLRMMGRINLADDPVRILRGYRLAGSMHLSVEAATRQAWCELASSVITSAPERLHEELLRWFGTDADVAESVGWCAEDGVLWELFPPLALTKGCGQNEFHHVDVWQHTLEGLEALERLRTGLPPELGPWRDELGQAWEDEVSGLAEAGALTRLALLLHDIGKPETREVREDGHVTFYGHQEVGAKLVGPLLERLKFSTDEIEYVVGQVLEHLRLGFYSDHDPIPPRLIYRFIRRLGDATPLMVLHALADCAATRGPLSEGGWPRHLHAATQILTHYYARDAVAVPPTLLDGNAIMQLLNLEPGPLVGKLKNALLEATAAGEVQTVDEAKRFIMDLHEKVG